MRHRFDALSACAAPETATRESSSEDAARSKYLKQIRRVEQRRQIRLMSALVRWMYILPLILSPSDAFKVSLFRFLEIFVRPIYCFGIAGHDLFFTKLAFPNEFMALIRFLELILNEWHQLNSDSQKGILPFKGLSQVLIILFFILTMPSKSAQMRRKYI